ncbi:MAG TPA: DUF4129 domain-containing protein, partial [Actinomycetota bacterium]|nr:DUF4129 domain-containing protein [Actinomycetota bacterium]
HVPSYATPGALNPTVQPTVEPSVSITPSTQPTGDAGSRGRARLEGTTTQHGRAAWVFPAVITAIAIGGVLLAILLAFTLPRVLRRRARGARSAAAVRYVEFLVWCQGAGIGRRQAETPLEHAARLRKETPDASEPLDRLLSLVDDALWAPDAVVDPRDVARAAHDARGALREDLSRRSRMLAAAGVGRWRTEI